MRLTRGVFTAGILGLVLAYPSQSSATAEDNFLQGLDPSTAQLSTLRARIERGTTKVSRILSPESRRIVQQSMNRFFWWADGYCRGDSRCLRNQYWNHLAAIPNSVYRVGRWTVYDTGIYALEWADDALQGMDPERAFTWNLRLTWPRVDFETSPIPGGVALALRAHKAMADWIQGGWDRSLDVHLEGMNDCYLSATISGSTYSGGAHPFEDFSTFNWNLKAMRAVQDTDLFRTDKQWKSEILALYRQRLRARGTDLSEWALSDEATNSLFADGFVITDDGLRFVERQGATRNETIPAIVLSWNDLTPWLIPGANCSMPSRHLAH